MKAFASLKEARKGLKLPGGENADILSLDDGYESYSWSKRGGYADKTLARLRESLKKMRWRRDAGGVYGSPDGAVIGDAEHYRRGGWLVVIDESYGVFKWDNRFHISLAKVG